LFFEGKHSGQGTFLPLPTRLHELHTGDLDTMMERKTIRVLTTFNMTDYFLHNGRARGFEYNLLEEFEKYLNRGRKGKELKVRLEWFPVPFNRLIPYLQEGRGDLVAAGTTITENRLQAVDFTLPYLRAVDEIVVTHKDVQGLNKIEDLAGRDVFVQPDGSYHEHLRALNQRLVDDGKTPIRILEVSNLLSDEDILELVNAGTLKMTVVNSHLARLWARVLPDIRVHENIKVNENGRIAWMVRKNSPLLKKKLNGFIQSHKQGTRLGNILFTQYFNNVKWISNPLCREQLDNLSTYAPLFKKYGKKYGIDWRLIAAQAYQESGLKHERRSKAGALGVMQVLPSTARDHRIRIPDITDPENNIHAAVKYLALLRDDYFNGPDIVPQARMRLALAAYNAGPLKIIKARRKTEALGYDKGKWFQNTEYGTLLTVGREPVRYVSNINKYYLSYVMAAEILRLRGAEKENIQEDTRPFLSGLPFPTDDLFSGGVYSGGFCPRSFASNDG
jgi:membrane-bound lytic murein transglycosylase MltF